MKRKSEQRGKSILRAVILGLVVMVLLGLAVCVIASWLLMRGKIDEQRTMMLSVIFSFFISAIGAYVAGKRAGGKYAIVCIGTVVTYFLVLVICTALLFSGQFDHVGLGLCACTVGGVLSCLLCTMHKKKAHKQKR